MRRCLSVLRAAAPWLAAFGLLLLGFESVSGPFGSLRWWVFALAAVCSFAAWFLRLRGAPSRIVKRCTDTVLIVGLAALLAGVLIHPAIGLAEDGATSPGCGDPVELTVLLPVDGEEGFEDAISDFNQRLGPDGCRKANVTGYAAPWNSVIPAKTPTTGTNAAGEPPLETGPRPHLWIAESQVQVDEADIAPDRVDPIGTTPLVLAVPGTQLEAGFNDGKHLADQPLPDLMSDLDVPVLRPDPPTSYTGLLFAHAMYGGDENAGGLGARLEEQLANGAATTGISSPASNTQMLCDLDAAQDALPEAAVLTTEAALARYNDGECSGTKRTGLEPVYTDGTGYLDYQAVTMEWSDDPWAHHRAEVAEDLVEWLKSDGDKMTENGIRDTDYRGGPIAGDHKFLKEFEPDQLDVGDYAELMDDYTANRVPTDALFAIDHSESMDKPSDGDSTRFDLAKEGVKTALGYLGEDDQAGLWNFPSEGDRTYNEVLAIGEAQEPADADRLEGTESVHGIDLHQMIIAGAEALRQARGDADDERLSAMVVLTDGADSETGIGDVHEALEENQVALHVIAVGDTACREQFFRDLKGDEPRVKCLDAEADQITDTFDQLFTQLWSGDD